MKRYTPTHTPIEGYPNLRGPSLILQFKHQSIKKKTIKKMKQNLTNMNISLSRVSS